MIIYKPCYFIQWGFDFSPFPKDSFYLTRVIIVVETSQFPPGSKIIQGPVLPGDHSYTLTQTHKQDGYFIIETNSKP